MTEQSNQSEIIDVKQAVFAARSYIESLQAEIGAPLKDLLLEEVELTDDREFWLITLGYTQLTKPLKITSLVEPPTQEVRKYKILKVNAETGKVESMKIRKL